MFALVAVLLALGSAHAGRALKAPMLPPLPIDPRAEAMAATITTADSLAAAVPLFSPTNTIMAEPTMAVQMDAFSAAAPDGAAPAPGGTLTFNAPTPADAPEVSALPPIALAPGAADMFAAESEMAPELAPGSAPAASPEVSALPPIAMAPSAADMFADVVETATGMASEMAPAESPEVSALPPVALAPGTADAFAAEEPAAEESTQESTQEED